MRKMGEVLLDMEVLLDEMCDQGLQYGDILSLVHAHLVIHRPDAQEQYEEGSNPIFYYGPEREDI